MVCMAPIANAQADKMQGPGVKVLSRLSVRLFSQPLNGYRSFSRTVKQNYKAVRPLGQSIRIL